MLLCPSVFFIFKNSNILFQDFQRQCGSYSNSSGDTTDARRRQQRSLLLLFIPVLLLLLATKTTTNGRCFCPSSRPPTTLPIPASFGSLRELIQATSPQRVVMPGLLIADGASTHRNAVSVQHAAAKNGDEMRDDSSAADDSDRQLGTIQYGCDTAVVECAWCRIEGTSPGDPFHGGRIIIGVMSICRPILRSLLISRRLQECSSD